MKTRSMHGGGGGQLTSGGAEMGEGGGMPLGLEDVLGGSTGANT